MWRLEAQLDSASVQLGLGQPPARGQAKSSNRAGGRLAAWVDGIGDGWIDGHCGGMARTTPLVDQRLAALGDAKHPDVQQVDEQAGH
ncbi:hypothetical protein CFE70_005198 [Pyrenophora teres f. teres 0-1]